jgi:hypothetical protein
MTTCFPWLLVLGVSPADASAGKVTMATPEIRGESGEHLTTAFGEGVRQGIEDAGHTPGERLTCQGSTCLAGSATAAVSSTVTADGSDYRISVEVRHPGGTITREGGCDICTYDEAAQALRKLVADALSELPADDGGVTTVELRVISSPAGATVEIDGGVVGTTPWTGQVTPGKHRVSVRGSGKSTSSRNVDVSADGQRVRFDLAPSGPAFSPKAAEIGGWVTLGVGVAMLAGGIAMLALDGQQRESCDPGDDCRYTTQGAGIALTSLGVVGVGLGTAFVIVSRKQSGKMKGGQKNGEKKKSGPSASFGPWWVNGRF